MFRNVIVLALLVSIFPAYCAQHRNEGFYSKAAHPIWDRLAGSPKPIVIPSPDSRSRAVARWLDHGGKGDDEHVVLDVEGAIGQLHLELGPGVGSELSWAADSKAFFVTSSNGGANGDYHLYVVDTFDGKLESRELTKLVSRDFGHPFRCGWKESPNVVGIGWVGNSHRLWVAAEVINHSNCDSFGTFRAYEVDPTEMRIVRSLNQLEAKRKLHPLLGRELLLSPDQCIRRPSACYVSTNHPEIRPN
jgi:hypothetical protein